jgi:hypothetical protein
MVEPEPRILELLAPLIGPHRLSSKALVVFATGRIGAVSLS